MNSSALKIPSLAPNLFDFATSELSQDAFIAWIASWADSKCKELDSQLHECGAQFVRALLKRGGCDHTIEFSEVTATMQHKRIDVLITIDDHALIVVEDKTFTADHSDQLERYKVVAGERAESMSPDCEVAFIYYKTGNEHQHGLRQNSFEVFGRKDILDALGSAKTDSDILNDYRAKVQAIEDRTNAYLASPVSSWTGGFPIEGFYQWIETELCDDDQDLSWYYVPNQSGGFRGCFWAFHTDAVTSHRGFLQLEYYDSESSYYGNRESNIDLVVRMLAADKCTLASADRHDFLRRLRSVDSELSFVKSGTFRGGTKTGGVAKVSFDDGSPIIAVDERGYLNKGQTLANFEKVSSVLRAVCGDGS